MAGPDGLWRRGALTALAAAAVLAGALAASPARAATCEALRAELQRVSAGGGQSATYRKWATAADKQQRALSLARRDARHLGCASAPASGSCPALTTKIKRMAANLAKIERQRDRHARPADTRRKAQLTRALARQGCDAPRRTETRADTQRGGGLLALFGIGRRDMAEPVAIQETDDGRSRVRITPAQSTPRRSSGPTFRTMCVRTCDGFYFPVSFSTTQKGFGRDAAICRSMCPGAEAQLFVHRNPGETAENLVSLDGMPYGELANAYTFRSKFVPDCSCQPRDGQGQTMASLIRSGDAAAVAKLRDTKPGGGLGVEALRSSLAASSSQDRSSQEEDPPAGRAPDGADPDTRMNLELGYAPDSGRLRLPVLGGTQPEQEPDVPGGGTVADIAPVAAPAAPDPDRPVRIVGPRYFVAQ
ncbi:DUF2865 domain-containing protein [Stappia sp.]|uniref:DUF2865 domain-containing protein n=1 Tax=Stappia sp. TaxID=1870903 RepID=UPI0032D92B05